MDSEVASFLLLMMLLSAFLKRARSSMPDGRGDLCRFASVQATISSALTEEVGRTVLPFVETLAATGGPPAEVLLDSTHVKAHRCAAGEKGGAGTGERAFPRRPHDQAPRPKRWSWPTSAVHADGWPDRGLQIGRDAPPGAGAAQPGDGRSRQRHGRDPSPNREAGCRPEHPAESHSGLEGLPQPALYRARNAVGCMFCRKDYRRIATRYDKLVTNFLNAVQIVASLTCWL